MSSDVSYMPAPSQQDLEKLSQLGQLLLRSGLITEEQLTKVGGSPDKPPPRLGQKLVLHGYISHAELHHALQVQCLWREERIEEGDALKIMQLVRREEMSVDEAMSKLNIDSDAAKPSSRFGDLLIDAGVISQEQLDDALERVKTTNIPLGNILTMNGLVSPELLGVITDIQKAIRQKAITRRQAIFAISSALDSFGPPEPEAAPPVRETVTQAETAPQAVAAPPAGKSASQDHPVLSSASIAQPLSPLPPSNPKQLSFGDFMVLCGVLRREDVDRARNMCDGTNHGIETVVRTVHAPKNRLVELAGYCFRQINSSKLTVDQGVFAFDFCKRIIEASDCTVADAAKTLSCQSNIRLL